MQVREIEVTRSSVTNGRIYFPISDAKFFPTDSLSDRERDGHVGLSVVFKAGEYVYDGPIRLISGQRLSPKRSFAKYLMSVEAKSGDRLLVSRTSEREYSVVHVST